MRARRALAGEAQLEIEHFWPGPCVRSVIDGDIEGGSLMAGKCRLVTREQSTAEIIEELGQPVRCRSSRRAERACDQRQLGSREILPGARRPRMSEAGGSVSATRRLLRRLRDIMAGSGTAQERPNKLCGSSPPRCRRSLLGLHPAGGEVLELFATEGLRPEAVHRTRLRVGEGLVGVIAATARPLALADAQSHPSFAYRPETARRVYHSLMGAPILRGNRVLGVLVRAEPDMRHYTEDEVEVLQTIAMIVAELAAIGKPRQPRSKSPRVTAG